MNIYSSLLYNNMLESYHLRSTQTYTVQNVDTIYHKYYIFSRVKVLKIQRAEYCFGSLAGKKSAVDTL